MLHIIRKGLFRGRLQSSMIEYGKTTTVVIGSESIKWRIAKLLYECSQIGNTKI